MTTINTLYTLGKREFLDHRVGFAWVPAVILAIFTLVLLSSLFGFGNISTGSLSVTEIANGIEKAKSEAGDSLSDIVALGYWGLTLSALMALPWVIYFTLSASLFDERKDRSILFFKSMPVADWQEVLSKLVTIGFVGPAAFITVMIAFQLIYMVILTLYTLVIGADFTVMLPLGSMITGWIAVYISLFTYFLWALPVFAWIVFASSWAPKVPFLLAAVPIVVIVVIEVQLTNDTQLGRFIVEHLGGGFGESLAIDEKSIKSPEDLFRQIGFVASIEALGRSLVDLRVWFGLALAALFFFGSCEMRRRAN